MLACQGQGSITSLVSETGGGGARGLFVAERYTYDSFGQLTVTDPAGTPRALSAFDNPYAFTGREFDPESGLYYNRHRSWDPHTGRFLQEDPLGLEEGVNLYPYVFNNPVNSTDPLGRFPRFLNKKGWDALKDGTKGTLKARYGGNFTEAEYEEVATDFANEARPLEAPGLDPQGVNQNNPEKRRAIAEGIGRRLEKKYEKDPRKKALLEKQRKLDAAIDGNLCPKEDE